MSPTAPLRSRSMPVTGRKRAAAKAYRKPLPRSTVEELGPATSTRSNVFMDRTNNFGHADHGVAGDQPREIGFAQIVGPLWAHRKDHEASRRSCRRPVSAPALAGRGPFHAITRAARRPFGTGTPRSCTSSRASQNGPRIARAERTHDECVTGGVLDDLEAGCLRSAKPKFGDRSGPVGEQAPPVRRIAPGAKAIDLRAWVDPAYRRRLLADGTRAIAEFGFGGPEAACLKVVENTPELHNIVVCTLCSCYPWAVLGLPSSWYKSAEYRSRMVAEPRALLHEMGLDLPAQVRIRVWDSSAETLSSWSFRCAQRGPTI